MYKNESKAASDHNNDYYQANYVVSISHIILISSGAERYCYPVVWLAVRLPKTELRVRFKPPAKQKHNKIKYPIGQPCKTIEETKNENLI